MNKFNLEAQYQKYLELMCLKESQMHPIQQQETRRAFYGRLGQMLRLLVDDVPELEEEEAFLAIKKLQNEVGNFFQSQLCKQT